MRDRARYTPGTDSIDITVPGGIAALLDFHRATFGDARMEADADAAAVVEEPKLNEHGFPDKTPWKDMEPDQQVAYWRHQARKHESRAEGASDYDQIKAERDELKAKHQTADEKAVEDATRAAAETARTEERAKLAPRLVTAEFKAANGGRIPADKFTAVLDGIEPTKFLTPEGEVDTDKVQRFVDGIAPADGKKWPDTGQGRRLAQKPAGVGAGRDLYESRRPKKS